MLSFKNTLIILATLILMFCIYFSQNIRLDASSDSLIIKNDKTFEYFEYYNKIFPTKNFLVLAVKSSKIIDQNYIENINNIKKQIENFENVEETFSILDAPILILTNNTLVDLAKKEITTINNSDYELKDILDEFSSSPIFKDQIINKNQNLSAIIIYIKKNIEFEKIRESKKKLISNDMDFSKINKNYIKEKNKNNKNKDKLIKQIRNLLILQENEYDYFLGGIDMIASDTINFIKKDIVVFSFTVILFIILILLIIYRNIKWVLLPLCSTIYSVLIMTGLMGFLKWEITPISSNFISLMLILSISMNIHIINNYKINYFNSNNQNKLNFTIKNIFWPCLYTTLTTIAAFGSLIFSNIKPVVDFGYIMIVALVIIFATSFTILPLLIRLFPKIDNQNFRFTIIKKISKFIVDKYKNILLINIIILTLSIYGITKLTVENSFINYFKSNTQIFKGMKLIDEELGGTTPIDIIITFKDDNISTPSNEIESFAESEEDISLEENFETFDDLFSDIGEEISWFTQEKIGTIKKIQLFLESKSEIGKVQSINSLIELANIINKKPLSIFELSVLYNEMPEKYKESLIQPFLSVDNNMIKISSRVKDSNKIKRKLLVEDINTFIQNNFDNIEKFEVNGLLVLYNNLLQSLFNSQIKSFGVILTIIFLMFIILFKSLKLSIIGMIPNIIASTSILGLIGILGIPLDIMTITIAAITIGIAVDNTIHYIYRFKENKKIFKDTVELIEKTNNNVGNAILTTSLTISFGFSVLCLSNFIPTILFGLFTALGMILAMLGVLITLPTIINRIKI